MTPFVSADICAAVRSFAYAYDAVGRPVIRDADAFAYNARGEVVSAAIGTNAATYAYDHIGNRTVSSDLQGARTYAANELNQYTNLTSNLSPLIFLPSYDADGNLLGDGSLGYAWNAAGRLASVTNSSTKLEFAYDWRGRRTKRTEYTWSNGAWTIVETPTFVYDDWNLIYERSERPSEGAAELAFFWGPDLSGTLQGAGGVGGLVAVSINGSFYFPGYDNNGNVVGYWDESGSLVAEYAYDAFGNTISSSGTMASVFPHRFSTKYYDSETGLYYYGYRYYSPNLGRWISRDPIEEEEGVNLYSIVGNCCLSDFDILGERHGDWLHSSEEDGWAFPGNMNFPGPGWSGTFRTRPTTQFDLAAKIHDLHYALNGIEFSAKQNIAGRFNPQMAHGSPTGKSAELSRKAKADYIFKMMNKFHWEGGRWSGILNFLSRRVFYGDSKFFCRGDDFANFLLQPESWQLNEPSFLLMIPYSQLTTPPTQNRLRTHSISVGGSKGSNRTVTRKTWETVPDFLSEVPDDRNPGFLRWMQLNMPDVLSRVYSMTDQTDSTFVW